MESCTVPSKTRQVLPPHTNPSDAELYLAACTKQERDLVTLAIKELGSSYFMEKSHGYKAWKESLKKETK
jgi:hypothetical protein